MAKVKRGLALMLGAACAVIGVVHLALGVASVPGESLAGATVDSRERFYGAIFAAYGVAWVWAARQTPPADRLMRFLAAAFLLGGLGRILSLVQHGQPHWFQLVLGALELVLPLPFLFPLSRRTSTTAAPATSSTPPTSPGDLNAASDVSNGSPVEASSETVTAGAEALTLVMVVDLTPVAVEDFQRYEDIVLRLLPRHSGRLHTRLRSADQCFESHLITFARRAEYDAFIADPDRTAARALLPDTGIDQRVIIVDEVLTGTSPAVDRSEPPN